MLKLMIATSSILLLSTLSEAQTTSPSPGANPSANATPTPAASTAKAFDYFFQKKYPLVNPSDSTLVVVNGKNSKIVPFSRYSGLLSKKNSEVSSTDQDKNTPTLPYVIIPDSEFFGFMARHVGYPGKPVNHINLNGVETIVFTSKEVDTSIKSYPGVANKPSNHVMMGGMETVLVKQEEFKSYLSKYPVAPGLPSNYLKIGGLTVVVLPINDGFRQNVPMPSEPRISPADRSTKWITPPSETTPSNGDATGTQAHP